jgi:hypothetical protein
LRALQVTGRADVLTSANFDFGFLISGGVEHFDLAEALMVSTFVPVKVAWLLMFPTSCRVEYDMLEQCSREVEEYGFELYIICIYTYSTLCSTLHLYAGICHTTCCDVDIYQVFSTQALI